MKRKILTLLLALAMVLTMLPMTALAAEGNVAEVNGQGYSTLQSAIDAANSGDTVKLIANVVQNTQLSIDKDITLDLNGKEVYNTADIWSDEAVALIAIRKGANVTITGNGTLKAKENDCYTINMIDGDLTIENGTIIGNVSAVQVQKGHLLIRGGTFSLLQKWNGKSTYLINIIDDAYKDGSGTVTIIGGTFVDYVPSQSTSENPAANFVPTGYAVTGDSGSSTVTKKADNEAAVNGIEYATLTDAITVAADGDTVKLLQNVEEDVTIPKGKTITLALNGKKLTNVSGDTITNNGNLTIVGEGTVDNVTNGKADIYNNGLATLNGGSYTRSQEAENTPSSSGGNSYYNILNHGVMTINSGVSVTSSGHFSSLIDNGYYSFADDENPRSGYVAGINMENPSLTISGGFFSGGINTIKNDDNGKLTILDGTFTNYTQAALQNHHIATVSGGTFEGTGVAKAVINCGNPKCTVAEHDQHNLTILNGKFKGEVTKNPDSTLIIYAGYFTSEPDAAYLAPGKAVYLSNLAGYDHMVAAVEPATPVTPSEPAVNPFNENAGKNSVKFGDVADNAWYASAVNYAVDKGLMNGTGEGKFSPEADTTRGMIVTILARLDGKNTSGTPWYQAGQRWAMEYEISDGMNMTGAITREQLVTMLFRYAVKNGLEAVTLSENLTQFTDASDISAWAVSAMQWAVGQGLIQGSNGQLRPQANASRAEVATILMRFCEVLCK